VEVILQLLNGETPIIEWDDEAVLGVVIAAKVIRNPIKKVLFFLHVNPLIKMSSSSMPVQ